MALDSLDFTTDDVRERLHALFEAAKTSDECEFASTLLRLRGMESAGWDPFVETHLLVDDLARLIEAPLVGHTKVRLGLLLYSHLAEVDAVYEVFANLTHVVRGERYMIDPFLDHYPVDKKGERLWLSTPRKVRALQTMLSDIGHGGLADVLDWFFYPPVRNAFAHADYTLYRDKFRTRKQGAFEIGGITTSELSLDALADLVNRALAFFGAFIDEYDEQRRSYTENKAITGRMGPGEEPAPVELLADAERGLYGLSLPPASPEAI